MSSKSRLTSATLLSEKSAMPWAPSRLRMRRNGNVDNTCDARFCLRVWPVWLRTIMSGMLRIQQRLQQSHPEYAGALVKRRRDSTSTGKVKLVSPQPSNKILNRNYRPRSRSAERAHCGCASLRESIPSSNKHIFTSKKTNAAAKLSCFERR
jgi:hypothetical protein